MTAIPRLSAPTACGAAARWLGAFGVRRPPMIRVDLRRWRARSFVEAVPGLPVHPCAPSDQIAALQSFVLASRWPQARRETQHWTLSAGSFACEASAVGRLVALDPSLRVAQSDYQRLKFFGEGLHVEDLHGLNDRYLAREATEAPVLWGRYQHTRSVRSTASVWMWGFRRLSVRPMSNHPLEEILRDVRLTEDFGGYAALVDEHTADLMARGHRPASVATCGRYFNVLIRHRYAAAFEAAGLTVGW